MPFYKQHNHLHLTKIIATFDFTSLITCNHCLAVLSSCIIMTDYVKCSKCTHCGCLCVSVSLDFLNHAHLELKFELKMTMNKCVKQTKCLFKLNAKVLHLFKTLKQNKSCTVIKVCCIAFKLNNDNNETDDEKNFSDSFNLDFLLKLMNFSFFIDLRPLSQTAVVFLHS